MGEWILAPATAAAWMLVVISLYWPWVKRVDPYEQAEACYGLVRHDYWRRQIIVAILPLNYPLRASYLVWLKLRMTWPIPTTTKLERAAPPDAGR